jgi:hypothetical protein
VISIEADVIGAVNHLRKLRGTVEDFAKVEALTGSPLPYARPIEFGRKRRGKWARKAGPARYLRRGLEQVQASMEHTLADEIEKGTSADAVMRKLAEQVQVQARGFVPVRSGRLLSSIVVALRRTRGRR